jgi:ribosomal protection tetracycline resistance protein
MDGSRITNIGIIAHVDAGKTTLTEQLLFRSGATLRPGSVDEGTAQTDYMAVERQRGISVKASTTYLSWKGTRVNLIDTPGHTDFAAEVERSLRVLDCAVLCLSAVEGVQAQSEQYCAALRRLGIPVLVFVNKTDRAGADVPRVLRDMKRILGLETLAFSDPDSWLALLADRDEELAEAWLLERKVDLGRLLRSVASQTASGAISPVLWGSALRGEGIEPLLDLIVAAAPPAGGDPDGPVAGVVFKVEHDRRLGRIAYVRLYSGTLRNRDPVRNEARGSAEKIVQIRRTSGHKAVDVGVLAAGDIAAVCGLNDVVAGDVLGDEALVPRPAAVVHPLLRIRIRPSSGQDYAPLVAACIELSAEDPRLEMIWVPGTRQLLLNVTGLIQVEILASLFQDRFLLDVVLEEPKVIYKETPVKAAIGFDAYTMPKPCWAVVEFHIEPLPLGAGVEYRSTTLENRIRYRYQGQVAQTVPKALEQGPLGWQVTDLRVTLSDGGDHPIHTHPLDFATVTPIALMKGLVAAGTRLLEPMQRFHISVPEESVGKMISRIVFMRGALDEGASGKPEAHGDADGIAVAGPGRRILEGRVPAATSLEFPVFVASTTGGRGILSMTFDGYEPCPAGQGETAEFRGISPLDRDRYILQVRGAIQ